MRIRRRCGYRKITLWTNSILDAALEQKAGFTRVESGRRSTSSTGISCSRPGSSI
ncbi:MAG: hypothetical protein R2708_28455 [Vicinamibacterales bacterium]